MRPDESFRHVEHVVARLVGDEVIAVEAAAEELERVVEAGQRLEVRDARARADRGEREGVELLILRRRVAGELDADIAAACRSCRSATLPPVYMHRVVLAADDGGAVGARAFDCDGARCGCRARCRR